MNTDNCVVFSAGERSFPCPVPQGALLIAADGGREYLAAAGLRPHLTVGDFDSLGYVPENALVHPREKDETDTMLACRLGLERGCRRFLIYGGLGGRGDHSFANLCTLSDLARRGCRACLVGKQESVIALGRGRLCFSPDWRGTVSVFAFGGEARVRLEGLRYSYCGSLDPSVAMGVSNEFTKEAARIQVEEGVILIFLRGEPERLWKVLEDDGGTSEV